MVDRKILDEIINDLSGTCQSLNEACEHFGIEAESLAYEDIAYIEDDIFMCNGCGWWCERVEEAYDNICFDCADEEDEEE